MSSVNNVTNLQSGFYIINQYYSLANKSSATYLNLSSNYIGYNFFFTNLQLVSNGDSLVMQMSSTANGAPFIATNYNYSFYNISNARSVSYITNSNANNIPIINSGGNTGTSNLNLQLFNQGLTQNPVVYINGQILTGTPTYNCLQGTAIYTAAVANSYAIQSVQFTTSYGISTGNVYAYGIVA